MTEITAVKTVAARLRRMARTPSQCPQDSADQQHPFEPKRKSKQDLVLGLLRKEDGALLTDLVEATGWLPHTVRAALTGLKKKGHKIVGTKADKATRYNIIAE